jgi:hypothetical protein
MNANKVWLDAIRDAVNRILESVEHTELAPYWWIDSMEDDAAIILHAVIRLEEQKRGLSVDEVMEVVLTWHNYSDMTEEQAQELCGNETPEEAYEDLRARLTAKLQGK